MNDTECFKSDLQFIFGMLKYRKDKRQLRNYILEHEDFFSSLPPDTYDVAKVFLESEERLKAFDSPGMTGGINMCKALEDLYQDGVREGRQEGIQEGIREGRHLERELTLLELSKEGLLPISFTAKNWGFPRMKRCGSSGLFHKFIYQRETGSPLFAPGIRAACSTLYMDILQSMNSLFIFLYKR